VLANTANQTRVRSWLAFFYQLLVWFGLMASIYEGYLFTWSHTAMRNRSHAETVAIDDPTQPDADSSSTYGGSTP